MKQDNLNDAAVYIGGVQAKVVYAGRSQYPGVDQIDLIVPEFGAQPAFASLQGREVPRASTGFQGGCANSVVVVASGISSNFGLLPVAEGGGTCSDPEYGTTGAGLGYAPTETISVGVLELLELTQPEAALPAEQFFATFPYAYGWVYATTGSDFSGPSSFGPSSYSYGSCYQYTAYTPNDAGPATTGLNAGTPIVLTGPGGLSVNMPEDATSGMTAGNYYVNLLPAIATLTPGDTYTFAAPGSPFVKPFTASVTWPAPLTWTNESSIGTITRLGDNRSPGAEARQAPMSGYSALQRTPRLH